MSFKLTTAESRLRDALQDDLIEAWNVVDTAVRGLNNTLDEAKAKVEVAISHFNLVAEHTKSFTNAIAERAQAEIDARSKTWLEGEGGGAASYWRDEWKCFDIEELDPEWPKYLTILKPLLDLKSVPEEAEPVLAGSQ